MGKTPEAIDGSIREFIEQQQMFFVATAPLADDGLINLSPKGLDSFKIIDEKTVAYADLAGSGVETIAHLKQNGRVVIMFCAFEGPPNIVRLHGTGEVIAPEHEEFAPLAALFPAYTSLRSVIRIHCSRISESCGMGVPLYEYQGQRSDLVDWADKNGREAVEEYIHKHNKQSLDGLEGFKTR